MVCVPALNALAGMTSEVEPPTKLPIALYDPAETVTEPVGVFPLVELTLIDTPTESFDAMLVCAGVRVIVGIDCCTMIGILLVAVP